MKEVDTDVSFAYWLKGANRRERAVYYRGFLMRDREILVHNGVTADRFPPKIKTALMAWKAHLNGTVKLTQKKIGPFEYEYIATKV